MKRDRNHEGYHDPTAGRAIQRASKRQKKREKGQSLTYMLKDARGFLQAVENVK